MSSTRKLQQNLSEEPKPLSSIIQDLEVTESKKSEQDKSILIQDEELDKFLNETKDHFGISTGFNTTTFIRIHESDHFKSLIQHDSSTHSVDTKSCHSAKC